jgi:hypothetical protein
MKMFGVILVIAGICFLGVGYDKSETARSQRERDEAVLKSIRYSEAMQNVLVLSAALYGDPDGQARRPLAPVATSEPYSDVRTRMEKNWDRSERAIWRFYIIGGVLSIAGVIVFLQGRTQDKAPTHTALERLR